MRISSVLPIVLFTILLIGCGGNEKKETTITEGVEATENVTETTAAEEDIPASERITLDEKGVGQIKALTLDPEIDMEMVAAGEALYKTNCTACHKLEKRFIGPSPKGIMKRRSPEWVMNMILDPQLMTEQDRCAKDLLIEFNGAAMANQNLSVEQARSIVEYFRTL